MGSHSTLIVVIAATVASMLLSACETDKIPFLSRMTQSAPSGQSADGQGGSSTTPIDQTPSRKITSVGTMASVMMDKKCHDIVQPYKLSDNMAVMAVFGIEQLKDSVTGDLGRMLGGAGPAQGQQNVIPAKMKLAAKQLNWLPMRVEKMYGERLHAQETGILARTNALGKKLYPIADAMLQRILSNVGQPYDYQFQLFILKSNNNNAIARPGGYLYVEKGLLDDPAKRPRAYFALAHEIAHVLQRHETQGLQSMLIDSISLKSDLMNLLSNSNGNFNPVLAHLKTGKNLFRRYHIDQELQADSCGTKLLARTFTDQGELAEAIHAFLKELPKPAASAPAPAPTSDVERLAASVHDIVDTPIARHPDSLERYNNLNIIYQEISKEMRPARTSPGGRERKTPAPPSPR